MPLLLLHDVSVQSWEVGASLAETTPKWQAILQQRLVPKARELKLFAQFSSPCEMII
jgi:hypothetical protein